MKPESCSDQVIRPECIEDLDGLVVDVIATELINEVRQTTFERLPAWPEIFDGGDSSLD